MKSLRIIIKIISNRFVNNKPRGLFQGIVALTLGSSFGRIITILCMPVLTRLYSPDDFGVLTVFTAFVNLVFPLVSLRYLVALPLPRREWLSINLFALSLMLILGLTGLLAVFLWWFGPPLFSLLSMEMLAPWWWLISIGILGASCYQLLTMWATRNRAYNLIAQTNITQSLMGCMVKVGMGVAGFQSCGLLFGQVVTQTGGVGRLATGFYKDFRLGWRHVAFNKILKVAWRYRKFPIWRVPSQFLMISSIQIPTLFLALLFNPQITGQYGLAVQAMVLPVSLLGNSVGQALYGEASKQIWSDRERVLKMCKNVQYKLFTVALPLAIIFMFFGKDIFVLFFGQEWLQAGVFASIMSISFVFQLTSAPLMHVMNLLAHQAVFLWINLIRFLGLLFVFVFSFVLTLGPMQTICVVASFSTLFYIFVSIFSIKVISEGCSRNACV